MKSFRDVIELWPSRLQMGADIGAEQHSVSKWFQRDSIPHWWWRDIAESDVGRKAGVTVDLLATMAAARECVR